MSRRIRLVPLLVLACLLLVACGSRVVPLSSDANGFGPAPMGTGSVRTEGSPNVSQSAGPGVSAPTGPAGTATRAPDTLPNCVPIDNAKEGVTKTTVKLGLVASLTGPLPGQFNSAVEATDSYVRMINDAGGICGRKFELLIRDDNGNGGTDLAVATKLADEDHVFAFVGSVSAPDDTGIAKVSKQRKIPDIGFPLTWTRSESPYTYGVPGQVSRHDIGEGASGTMYLNRTFGIKQVAIFWLKESEVSILEAWAFEASMQRVTRNTMKFCHEQPAGVLDNNYTNYVVSMMGDCDPANGPIAVYSTMENNANVKLAIAMKEQGFKPKVFGPTFSSYLPAFIDQAGGATEGAYLAIPMIPFERLSAPRSTWSPGTHELKRYLDNLKRYHPRYVQPGSFGAPGWGSAALFFDMAKQCGAKLTRACLLQKLDASGPFSANGMLAPTLPRLHTIYHLDLIIQVRNGKFVEIQPDNRSGPKEGPDFWDMSDNFDFQKYICDNQSAFPNMTEKKKLLDTC